MYKTRLIPYNGRRRIDREVMSRQFMSISKHVIDLCKLFQVIYACMYQLPNAYLICTYLAKRLPQ